MGKKPEIKHPIIEGNYYWVKPYKNEEFEPAKCKNYYGKGVLYFCFTNGSIMEAERSWEFEPLIR